MSSSATATAQSDLDKLAGCESLVGNLTVSGSLGSAALSGVKNLYGSLTVFNATSLATFSADSLETITGALTLQQLTVLNAASFGSLASVDSIILVTLPAIDTFASNLQSANSIYISDTTLENIEGFSSLKNVKEFNINNNKDLTSVTSSLESVSDALEFSFNGNEASVVFDSLVWANNITLRDVASASFAKLESVNASMGFINNTLSNLNLTKLTKVGQSLSFTSNDALTSLSCANLTAVGGGFVVANNTELLKIDGFKNLATVGGAIVITGNFTEVDLDSLKSVKGGASFDSSAFNFSCSALNKLQKSGAIQGDSFVCKNGATSTSVKLSATSDSSSTATDSSDGSISSSSSSSTKTSKSSKNAAGQFAPVSNFMGAIAAVVVALL